MGQGREHKTRDDAQVEIQERGEIFFFYRPKVNKPEAHRVDDAQRLYIVLSPESGERLVEEKQDPQSGEDGAKEKSNQGQSGSGKNEYEGGKGRQAPPLDPSKKSQPFWGFVELVTTKIEDVKSAMKGGINLLHSLDILSFLLHMQRLKTLMLCKGI
ncbi:hypothetical protein SCA6_019293 [Theobroma cacao]